MNNDEEQRLARMAEIIAAAEAVRGVETYESRRNAEKICGWLVRECGTKACHPHRVNWEAIPNYCQDRNAVAEMEEAIERAGWDRISEYLRILECLLFANRIPTEEKGLFFCLRTAEPRLCVEAGLRAFGLWEE